MRRIGLLAGHGIAAAAAAMLSIDGPSIDLSRPEPQLPRLANNKAIRRMRQPHWRNDGVRANKQYRLKGIRP